jgi:AcrR family transcriptional regulator
VLLTSMSTSSKKRLPQEESRLAALEAARTLLIEAGPQAVTLKAVGARVGRTHANLLHHFKSAAGLQMALAKHLTEAITREVALVVPRVRAGEADMRRVIDLAFDAFDRHGAGALTSWMILSGNEDMLKPIVDTIHKLVDDIGDQGHADRAIHDDTLMLVLMALGDALMGDALAKSLGLPRTRARDIAEQVIKASMQNAGLPV